MSAYTTLYVTRGKAMEIFMRGREPLISDLSLEIHMDDLLDERLYNCIIVDDDYEGSDDDRV